MSRKFGIVNSKGVCRDTSLNDDDDIDCEKCWKLALEGDKNDN